jgi:hypothetical protein
VSVGTSVCLNNVANLFKWVKKRTDLMMAATDLLLYMFDVRLGTAARNSGRITKYIVFVSELHRQLNFS